MKNSPDPSLHLKGPTGSPDHHRGLHKHRIRGCGPSPLFLSLLSLFQLTLEHSLRIPAPLREISILNGISLSRGAPAPFHYPPPHLKRPRLRSTKLRVKRKKGGRQEKKNLLIYTDYSEQEENDGLHHTSPTHNKRSTIQPAVRK